MKSIPWQTFLSVIEKAAWALFLVCLPVTSFPYFPPAIGGGALVRPLSLYPLIVLILLVIIPALLRGDRRINSTLVAFLPFVLVAVASSALALLRGIEALQDISVIARLLRALVTLALGGAMYLTVALVPRTLEDLRASLRWLYAGFAVALLWGSLQSVYIIHYSPRYFEFISQIQRYVSIRRLFTNRISGMTYEPNWFAEQISFLLLPWLLAAVLTGTSVFRWRWKWVTIEWLLMVWAILVLIFTFSRAGLAILLILAFVGLLFFRPERPRVIPALKPKRPIWIRRLVEAGAGVLVLVVVLYFVGSNNAFFSRIWDYWQGEKKTTSLTGYLEYLAFGARIVYGETAYQIYEANPVIGVGLGNYAFYFESMLPDRPLADMPEVLRLLTPEPGHDRLITPKNLYLRILAETGLVGMAAFLAFIIAVTGCAIYLWKTTHKKLVTPVFFGGSDSQYWGVAGMLGIVAFIVSAISFDSFAIPNMWIVFGLITAAAWIIRRSAGGSYEWRGVRSSLN